MGWLPSQGFSPNPWTYIKDVTQFIDGLKKDNSQIWDKLTKRQQDQLGNALRHGLGMGFLQRQFPTLPAIWQSVEIAGHELPGLFQHANLGTAQWDDTVMDIQNNQWALENSNNSTDFNDFVNETFSGAYQSVLSGSGVIGKQ